MSTFLYVALMFTLLAPLLQHLVAQIQLYQSGVVVTWGDADDVIGRFGVLRYSKDIMGALISVAGVAVIFRSKSPLVRALMRQCALLFTLILLTGLAGHVLDPQPLLLLAGLRWMLHAGAAVGLCLIIVELDLWHDARFRRLLAAVCFIALAGNAAFVAAQVRLEDGYLRYTGLFSNAGVMGYYVMGITLVLEVVLGHSLILCSGAYALALYSAMKSGSRAAMIIVLFLWIVFSVRKLAGKNTLLLILSLPFLVYGAWFSITFAESTADRGRMIADQFGAGGRISNIVAFSGTLQRVPLIDIIVGKGFGYGTNSAFGFTNPIDATHPWYTLIDNGYITWFMQFGFFGIIILAMAVVAWCQLFLHAVRNNPEVRFIAIGCMLTPLLLMMIGNILEQFGLLAFLALAVSWILSGRRIAARPWPPAVPPSRLSDRVIHAR